MRLTPMGELLGRYRALANRSKSNKEETDPTSNFRHYSFLPLDRAQKRTDSLTFLI
jgi:hypothetical protein